MKRQTKTRSRASVKVQKTRRRARTPRRADDTTTELLREQTERLRLGQTTARMIVMDWDVRGDTLAWSDSPEWLRGPLPAGGTYPLFREQVHPDDRQRWLAMRAEGLAILSSANYDYRIVRTDGEVLWVHSQRAVFAGADGKAQRMLIAVHDITERKSAEESLRQSEARFRSLTDLSSDWYWEQDAELRFVSTSGRESGRGGITAADHTGRRRWELPGTEIANQSWEEHQATLAAREPFRDVLLRRTAADGAVHYVSVSGEPIVDGQGAFTGYRGIARDVTERIVAEQQARAADERLRAAVEDLNEGFCLCDQEDRIVFANRWFREANPGLEEYLAPGCKYEEHERAGIARGYYPEAVGREDEWLAQRQALRRNSSGPVERQRQGGMWLLVSEQRLPDGSTITYGLDITERKKAELALSESEDRYRKLIDVSPDAIFVHSDWRIVLVNQAMLRLFRAESVERLLGREVLELIAPESRENVRARITQMYEKGLPARPIEISYIRADGTRFSAEATAAAFIYAGRPAAQVVARDITERKRIEKELQSLNETLEERVAARTEELRAAVKEMGAFSYTVSHDLRAPLGAINGFTQLLRMKEADRLTEDGRKLLGFVESNATRMVELVDGLLEFSRLGRQALSRRPVPMGALVEEVLGESRARDQAEVRLGALPEAECDPLLLKQVWANLIGNALKYSRGRAPARIEIGFEEAACAYYMRDNGVGFDMQHAAKLFGVFERLHSDTEFEGTGLGLAIVERIVRRHGGRIWAEAALGVGATFRFTLGASVPG